MNQVELKVHDILFGQYDHDHSSHIQELFDSYFNLKLTKACEYRNVEIKKGRIRTQLKMKPNGTFPFNFYNIPKLSKEGETLKVIVCLLKRMSSLYVDELCPLRNWLTYRDLRELLPSKRLQLADDILDLCAATLGILKNPNKFTIFPCLHLDREIECSNIERKSAFTGTF